MKKKGICRRGITLFLCTILAFETPMAAMASESVCVDDAATRSENIMEDVTDIEDATEEIYTVEYDSEQSVNAKPVELVSERTENSRTFQLSDHSVKKLVYPYDINFRSDGEYILINNGLYAEKDSLMSLDGKKTDGYRNIAGKFRASFADIADENKLFSINSGNNSVAISIIKNDLSISSISDNTQSANEWSCEGRISEKKLVIANDFDSSVDSKNKKDDYDGLDVMTIEEAEALSDEGTEDEESDINSEDESDSDSSSEQDYYEDSEEVAIHRLPSTDAISYENIFDGVDFEFYTTGNGVEESIKISSPESERKFRFFTNGTDLSLKNNVLYFGSDISMEEPEIFDASGRTFNAKVSLSGKNSYEISVPESVASEADFPITIQTVKKVKRTTKNTDSLCSYKGVYSVDNGESVKSSGIFSVGVKDKLKGRGYLKLKMPELPSGSVVTKAELNLKVSGGGKSRVLVYNAESKNLEDLEKLTWKKQPFGNDISNLKPLDYNDSDGHFDITKAAKKWYRETDPYCTLMFAIEDEKECSDVLKKIDLESKGNTFLEITYKSFTGLEDYWSSHEQSAGNAGTGTVNDYTAKLTFVHEDAASSGLRMPLSVEHAYSTDYKSDNDSVFGNGWRLSTEVTLKIPSGYADIDKYPYVYTDSDGTEHYFKKKTVTHYIGDDKKTVENGSKWKDENLGQLYAAQDEDGLGLFVVPVTEKEFKNDYPLMITDRAGTVYMYFDRDGNLGLVRDGKYDASNPSQDSGTGQFPKETIIIVTKSESAEKEYNAVSYKRTSAGRSKAEEEISKIKNLKEEIENSRSSSDAAAAASSLAKAEQYFREFSIFKTRRSLADEMQKVIENLEPIALDGKDKNSYYKKINGSLEKITSYSSSYLPEESRISEIEDPSGDKAVFSYSDGRLVSVTDPAGASDGKAVTEFTYDDNGNLSGISHTDGRKAAYKYDEDNRLIEAVDEAGRAIRYSYSDDGVSVKKVEECVYTENKKSDKTDNPFSFMPLWGNPDNKENSKKATVGQAFLIELTDNNETIFTFSGKNDKLDSDKKKSKKKTNKKTNSKNNRNVTLSDEKKSDDVKNIYCFDNNGRTLSITSRLAGTNEVIGAGSYSYADAENSDENNSDEDNDSIANKLSEAAQAERAAINLLADSGFENGSSSWMQNGAVSGKVEINSHEKATKKIHKRTGKYTAKIKLDNASDSEGGYISQTVEGLDSGKIYTASVYLKTDEVDKASAALKVLSDGNEIEEYEPDGYDDWADDDDEEEEGDDDGDDESIDDPDGADSDSSTNGNADILGGDDVLESGNVEDNTPSEIANGWRRLTRTFKAPAGKTEIRFVFAGKSGTAYWDCAQLEKNETASQYNMLENSSFENGSSSMPEGWEYDNDGGEKKGTTISSKKEAVEGKKYFSIEGESNKTKILKTKPGFDDARASYVLSAHVNADCTPVRKGRKCEVRVKNSAGNTVAKTEIDPAVDGWQYVTLRLPTKNYNGCRVEFVLKNSIGKLAIDNCMLAKNDVQKWKYGRKSGKLIERKVKEKAATYAVDSRGRKKKTINEAGNKTEYSYDKNTNNLLSAENSTGTDYYYSYTKYGATAATIEKGKNEQITAKKSYSSDGEFLSAETDSRGNESKYEYDEARGLLTKSTLPNHRVHEFSYDTLGQVTSSEIYTQEGASLAVIGVEEKKESSKAEFSYDKQHNLKTIDHNDENYSFSYDKYGNFTEVVKTVSKNETLSLEKSRYAKRNGKLKSTTVGGEKLSYKYNKYEQIEAEKWSDGKVSYFRYDNNGRLAKVNDKENALTYSYNYDDAGRISDALVESGSKGSKRDFLALQNTYDNAGRISTFSYRYKDTDVKTSDFEYLKDNSLEKTTLPSGAVEEFEYDGLGRIIKSTFTTKSKNKIAFTYEYTNGTAGTTRLLKSKLPTGGKYVWNGEGTGDLEYDNAGKIIKADSTTYEYDDYDRLVSATDSSNGNVWKYSYDDNGNLTSSEYNGEKSVYTYDKKTADLLTAYRGSRTVAQKLKDFFTKSSSEKEDEKDKETIEYNNVGNPVKYLGKKLSWEHGRMLRSVKDSDNDIDLSFSYRNDGTRLTKKSGDETTEYILNGQTILGEVKSSGEQLNYYYSGNGTLLQIGYIPSKDAEETYYTVVTNKLGDISEIYNDNAQCVGRYSYDPYGKTLNIEKLNDPQNILEKNPFRYRGYYCDIETGWYYLNSRYYDPEVKRFISQDSTVLLTNNFEGSMQYNLYMYCEGDPISGVDVNGHFKITNEQLRNGAIIAGIAIVAVAVVVATGGAGGGLVAAAASSMGSSVIAGTAATGAAATIGTAEVIGAGVGVAVGTTVYLSTLNYDENKDISRREAFRKAKESSDIPRSSEYKTHKYVYDSETENRTVYEFDVDGEQKYIIEHNEDKFGRGPHFHGADGSKGSPFCRGRYNQYPGHYPEDFQGFR